MKKIYQLMYKKEGSVTNGAFIKVSESDLKKVISKEISHVDFVVSLSKRQITQHQKRDDFEIFTIDLIDSAVITKDNIHLYYEFMSSEDLIQNESLIVKVLDDRFKQVCFNLGVTVDVIQDNARYTTYINQYFGVKDTLKPIDEYIAEIKESSEYKEYAKECLIKQVFESAVKNDIVLLELEGLLNLTDDILEINGGDIESLYKQTLLNMRYDILKDYSLTFDL